MGACLKRLEQQKPPSSAPSSPFSRGLRTMPPSGPSARRSPASSKAEPRIQSRRPAEARPGQRMGRRLSRRIQHQANRSRGQAQGEAGPVRSRDSAGRLQGGPREAAQDRRLLRRRDRRPARQGLRVRTPPTPNPPVPESPSETVRSGAESPDRQGPPQCHSPSSTARGHPQRRGSPRVQLAPARPGALRPADPDRRDVCL